MRRSTLQLDGPRRPATWLRTLRSALWYLPLVHLALPRLLPWPQRADRLRLAAPFRWGGRVVALAGSTVMAWAVVCLVRDGQGTPAPHDPPRRLVCDGPYRYCRNPMELGNLLTLVGRAIAAGSPRLMLASLLFGVSIHGWIVRVEEPYLRRQFGPRYQVYQRRTPRWGWSVRQSLVPQAGRSGTYTCSLR